MRLAVNIDHVATVREARKAREPEPIAAAILAELAGAEGITVHLRGDRRHIQERDVELLRRVVSTKLNVEMAATEEMSGIARRIEVDQVTLVPEQPDELTTQGGLDVVAHAAAIRPRVAELGGAGIRVSMFIDPEVAQVAASREIGADAVEINTGGYADAPPGRRGPELGRILEAVYAGKAHGLEVLAGHGLTYVNIRPIAAVKDISELNIGHSIVARSVLVGIDRAVREMVALLG
jgi:pyridoxine 5-phosphate synthase